MTDAVEIAAIVAASTGIPTIVLGLLTFITARRADRRAERNEEHLRETKENIVMLEKNTNSIKDALVKVTGEAEFAKGLKVGHEAAVGATGAQGPQGDAGPQGEAGQRGKVTFEDKP